MPNEEERRKKVAEKTTFWQKAQVAFTPGDVNDRARKLEGMADDNIAEEKRKAQLEALRQRRMREQASK